MEREGSFLGDCVIVYEGMCVDGFVKLLKYGTVIDKVFGHSFILALPKTTVTPTTRETATAPGTRTAEPSPTTARMTSK